MRNILQTMPFNERSLVQQLTQETAQNPNSVHEIDYLIKQKTFHDQIKQTFFTDEFFSQLHRHTQTKKTGCLFYEKFIYDLFTSL